MGARRETEKAILFTGLFSQEPERIAEARRKLERIFGKVKFQSSILDFSHTNYYRDEFGDALKRQFIAFSRPVSLEKIYKTKLCTNRIEGRLAKDGKRTVNIDPGYLTLSKVVLLTTKDYTHRLYLANGIYGEVTLYYKDKTFNPWPWTYPDYKTKSYIDVFNGMRQLITGRRLKQCS